MVKRDKKGVMRAKFILTHRTRQRMHDENTEELWEVK